MTDQTEQLEALIAQGKAWRDAVDNYLDRWPSNSIAHQARAITNVLTALRLAAGGIHDAEQAATRTPAERSKKYDEHTLRMAEMRGETPEEFLAWQKRRQAEMAAAPSLEEQLATSMSGAREDGQDG